LPASVILPHGLYSSMNMITTTAIIMPGALRLATCSGLIPAMEAQIIADPEIGDMVRPRAPLRVATLPMLTTVRPNWAAWGVTA